MSETQIDVSETKMETELKRFQSFQPPILKGTETPVDCENWLEDIEILFEFLGFTDDCRITLIENQLQEFAKSWWRITKEALEQRSSRITWKIFEVEFYQRFSPLSYRQDKSAEFSDLRQGHLSIDEYLALFLTLLRFASITTSILNYCKALALTIKGAFSLLKNRINQLVFCA